MRNRLSEDLVSEIEPLGLVRLKFRFQIWGKVRLRKYFRFRVLEMMEGD